MLKVFESMTRQHEPRLVALAAVICAIACFATLNLLSRVTATTRQTLVVWIAAALVFGCGVWSLHFVAMLAFLPGTPIAYDLSTTLLSLGASSGGAIAAFGVYVHFRGRPAGVIVGGLLLSVAIDAMHYLGVSAIRLAGEVKLDPARVVVSVIVCAIFTLLTLARATKARTIARRIEASVYLMLAIGGMYFVAMSGLTIEPAPTAAADGTLLGSGSLAVAVGAVGIAILAISLAGEFMDQHLSERMRAESQRLLQLAGAAFEGIVIHRDGLIVDANPEFCRLGGWEDKSLVGRPIAEIMAVEQQGRLAEQSGSAAGGATEAVDLTTATRQIIPIEIITRTIDFDGEPAQVVGVRDLSARLRAEEKIRHLAHHDALTGLPNRFLLQDRLTNALNLANRNNTVVAVFYLDLDRFKPVNDLLGHEAGDALLVEVGRRLRDTLRSSDTLARIGGDEFAIVQPLVLQPREAASLARRVIESLGRPFDLDGQQAEIGVSIGIAVYPTDGGTAAELLHNADTAMYRAKQDGRGTFLFFEAAMDDQLQQRRQLEQALRQAIGRGQLELYYQPLFDCGAATVAGFEALIRWNHPTRGMIAPIEFIPLAEECGLIGNLGRWVLEQACAEAATWDAPHRIAVNLSPAQFRQADFPEMVAEILERTGLPAARLELEVTEGVLIDNTDRALEVLLALKALGVNISLDDFGTGYSSLSYLRRFPFDKIKIDKAFVTGLGQDDEAAAIVRAIVALGRSLRLSVTAEGVETQGQLEILQALDCHHVQGFLLGRPMPQHRLPNFLDAQLLLTAEPAVIVDASEVLAS